MVVFVDFKSGFYCVHRPSLWTALEVEHVSLKIICLLQKSYSGSISCVRIRNETTKEFCIRTGVRQGDAASPILFNVAIDSIMRKAFKDKQGVHYAIYRYATDLAFADYSAILADTDAEATDTLNDISRFTEPFGLKINIDKTKVLTTDGSPANMYLEGIKIEHVQNFKYLGSLVQERRSQWLQKCNVVSVKQKQCLHRLSGASGRRPISRLRPRCVFSGPWLFRFYFMDQRLGPFWRRKSTNLRSFKCDVSGKSWW